MRSKTPPYPARWMDYTLRQISKLDLQDIPCLLFNTKVLSGKESSHPIQGVDVEVPETYVGLEKCLFYYSHTTSEQIPVFICKTPIEELLEVLNVEVELDPYLDDLDCEVGYYIYPKCVKPEQYHKLSQHDKVLVSASGEEYPAPKIILDAIESLSNNPILKRYNNVTVPRQ